MKVLSFDPSSSVPGIAYFVEDKPQECFSYKLKGDNLLDRMDGLLPLIDVLIHKFEPDYIAVETPYLGISRSTSMKMGQIFGIFCAIFLLNGYTSNTIIEIHPMTAKKAAGVGHFKDREEGKETVMQKMREKYPTLMIKDDNEADAVAIGLAAIKEIYERQPNKIS